MKVFKLSLLHNIKQKIWAPIILILVMAITARAQESDQKTKTYTTTRLIYHADFKKKLDAKEWIVEMEPDETSCIKTQNGKLMIDSKGGVTVWLNKKLKGNFQIEFDRTVLIEKGINDRLSDLNQFWMAHDPHNSNLFARTGPFEQYDSLRLYYVGVGGNTNSTTRFRKYDGSGNRILLQEYSDPDHLLKSNQTYHIQIIVCEGVTSFWINNECYFRYRDPDPIAEGYFGFRTVHSRQSVDNFKIYRIK